MKNKLKIAEELKRLINHANGLLNANQNKQRVTAYLYIIFSFFALSFFGIFAIGPTISTISTLNKQYEEGTIALKQLEAKNGALKSLSSQYVTIQQDLFLIDNAIPKSPKVAELTRQIEVLTLKNNLSIQKLDTGLMEVFPAKNSNSSIFSFSFGLSVLGSEKDINNFVGEFIKMGRIIAIDKLSTGNQNDIFSVSINGKAYFFKE